MSKIIGFNNNKLFILENYVMN